MNTREKQIEMLESEEHERRMAIIAQNGNSGEHYNLSVDNFDVVYEEVKEPTKAELRKATPVFSGVLKYFPNALKEVAKCSQAGNDQHHPNKPLHWDMDKSKDEYDALTRHLIDHTINPIDDDGVLHLAKVAWRALAGLERHLTNKD